MIELTTNRRPTRDAPTEAPFALGGAIVFYGADDEVAGAMARSRRRVVDRHNCAAAGRSPGMDASIDAKAALPAHDPGHLP